MPESTKRTFAHCAALVTLGSERSCSGAAGRTPGMKLRPSLPAHSCRSPKSPSLRCSLTRPAVRRGCKAEAWENSGSEFMDVRLWRPKASLCSKPGLGASELGPAAIAGLPPQLCGSAIAFSRCSPRRRHSPARSPVCRRYSPGWRCATWRYWAMRRASVSRRRERRPRRLL